MCQASWQKAGWGRVKSGSGGANRRYGTVLNQCLGLLADESMILYSFFILCRETPGTLSSVLLGKRIFNPNLRFWPWPAKWVVLTFIEAGKNHN